MWTTVYVARGIEKAKIIEETLKKEGFLVKIKLIGKENKEELYEILAPEFEARDIEEAMIELGIL